MSVFWNKNDTTRQLLYGSAIVEIPASGGGGTLVGGGNQIFTVNNDIDALGDLYLQLSMTCSPASPYFLLTQIKRIEYIVGTQIWQTLETQDILGLNQTEMSEGCFEAYSMAASGYFQGTGPTTLAGNSVPLTAALATPPVGPNGFATSTACFRLPCLSRTVGTSLAKFTDISEGAYLIAGAPHQQVKIKVYLNKDNPNIGKNTAETITLRLFGQHMIMCNEEREHIKAAPVGLPKRIKMTQNVTHHLTPGQAGSFTPAASGNGPGTVTTPLPFTVDLDVFSLFASHLIIYVDSDNGSSGLTSADLKLNSSSYSGELSGAMLTGSTADALGLYSNQFMSEGVNVAPNYYIFPIASTAYGGSSVPLNRFDSIRLTLQLNTPGTGEGNPSVPNYVSVTCVGETTALYKGGAASLAMY
jgi:hypothetical protein